MTNAASSTITNTSCFSALQRAEIAEMHTQFAPGSAQVRRFSALQRAEIAEIGCLEC